MEERLNVEEPRENKMGTMPVPRLLFSMSVPIIISMLVQALYNIVDSIFVAAYNNVEGTAALTMAFPMQNLMIAVSVGLAVGMNALLSRSLGQKDFEKADKIAGQGYFLTLCGYALFLITGLFFVTPYIKLLAGNDTGIVQYGVDYLSIVCVGSVGLFVQVTGERLLQSTGKSMLSMFVQLSGAIVNIILDPILIFGWLGLPSMGVTGAAIATVIGQMVSGALALILNICFNKEITLRLRNLLPDSHLLLEILIIGIPSVLMQAIGSVLTFCINKILIMFPGVGVTAMNVFGIYFKLQSFVFMPIFGLNNGMVPIVAYNYGARNRSRVVSTIKLSAVCAVGYMTLGLLAFQIFPDALLSIFNATEEMLAIGRVALRIISLSFVFAGFCIVTGSVCQALGKSIYSLITSVGRQLVVLLPVFLLLSLAGNVDAVWWAFPIAEIMSLALSLFFMVRILNKTMPKETTK